MANSYEGFKTLIRLKREIESQLTNKTELKKLGEDVKKLVQDRTRDGFGVNEQGGKKQKLPKLKESTKKIRENFKKTGRLTGERATVNKSNMSRTGKTLDGIKVKVHKSGVTIELDAHGKEAVRTTQKVDKGYNFMALSKSEVSKVIKGFNERIISKLGKFFK